MKSKGFTVIELMIVISIIAILLAIAIPAYNNHKAETSGGMIGQPSINDPTETYDRDCLTIDGRLYCAE